MLTRRHLRIKVLQSLYAFYQSEENNVMKSDRQLFDSINNVYDLYLIFLILPLEIKHQAELKLEEGKNKLRPTKEDLNPNTKFINHPLFSKLSDSEVFKGIVNKKKLSWLNQIDLIKALFNDVRNSEIYKSYMASEDSSFEFGKKFFIELFTKILVNNDKTLSFLEEENVYWQDDVDLAAGAVVKTIQALKVDSNLTLLPLWKNQDDDESFAKKLFNQALMKRSQTDEWIKLKADNWELERIASMDLIIMNMAIAEVVEFPEIPVKVSLNEYIDLAKEYSTPKSGTFVNGILDKVFLMLKNNGTIKKSGRGLIE